MQLLGRKKKSWKLIITISLILLSGCSITNWFLWRNGESGGRDTIPVELNALIEMAEYSQLIYEKKDGGFKESVVEEQYGVSQRGQKDVFSYYVKQDNGVTILVFRGTNNAQNVLTDLDARFFHDDNLDLKLHRGFRDASEKLYEAILTEGWLCKNDVCKIEHTVYLTGHSLGGAIAQIIGMWLHEKGHNVQIFTFGSPKVTTKFLFNEPNHWRVAIGSDPIPFLPPFPYVHSGIHIDPKTLDWDETHKEGSFLKIDGLDHSIDDYLGWLKKNIDK